MAKSKTTTDHEEIRHWAEARGGKPAAVKAAHRGKDAGIVRIMFPKGPHAEHDELEDISWDEFFRQFDESSLAPLYEPDSMFSRIIGREATQRREPGERHASRHHRRLRGRINGAWSANCKDRYFSAN
jgi:hypothetical protein